MSSVSAPDVCAACGKGEENSFKLKACTACKLVKYCNRDCQIAHRKQHKKECKKRVAELHDEALFREPPPLEECPICFLPLPLDASQTLFQSCCGKRICCGCDLALFLSEGKTELCFCRTPDIPGDPNSSTAHEEQIKRTTKLMSKGNAWAYYTLAGCYAREEWGLPQDLQKANELLLKAGELGSAEAYCNLGNSYQSARGVERDMKKAIYYWELAAMGGYVDARYNLGAMEQEKGNIQRAMKHFILAARAGDKEALERIKTGFMKGIVTKDEYASTLRAHHERHEETKSDTRDKAAAIPNWEGWR